jgi:hypothetical protein
VTDKLLQQFRNAVYQSLLKRPDAVLDLIDALTVAGHVESPVTLSEQTPFRRKFSMVYDTLSHAVIDLDALLHTLLDYQPGDSETMGGYEVYGLDATKDERPEAETLPERCSLKSQKDEPVVYGHKYSWLVRLVGWGTSWVAPQDTFRIDPELSDSQVGSQQVKELAGRNPKPKVVVADSLYGNHVFLAIFLLIQNTYALVRMRSNNALYEQPEPRQPGKKGAPKKHGAKFKLSSPARPADGAETFLLGLQTVHIQAWNGLHLKKLPKLIVMLLRVEFLKPDGKPRYKQPMWLLWTGPTTVPLQSCARCTCGALPSSTCSGFSNKTWASIAVAPMIWSLPSTGCGCVPWLTGNCCSCETWSKMLVRPGIPVFEMGKGSNLRPGRCSERLYDIYCSWAHRPKHPNSPEMEKVA